MTAAVIGKRKTYYDHFVQAAPTKLFSEEYAFFQSVGTVGERIDQGHGCRASLPHAFLVVRVTEVIGRRAVIRDLR